MPAEMQKLRRLRETVRRILPEARPVYLEEHQRACRTFVCFKQRFLPEQNRSRVEGKFAQVPHLRENRPMRSPQLSEGTWAAVRALAQIVGVREAARRFAKHGVTEAAARKRSQRENWAQDGPFGKTSPVVTTLSPAATVAQAMAAEMKDLSSKTRLGHARAQAAVAEHVAERSGAENLEDAQNVKAAAQTSNLVFGWNDAPAVPRLRLDVLLSKPGCDVVEIEAELTESDGF